MNVKTRMMKFALFFLKLAQACSIQIDPFPNLGGFFLHLRDVDFAITQRLKTFKFNVS